MYGRDNVASSSLQHAYNLLAQEEPEVAGSSTMAATSSQAKTHDEYELSERKTTRVSIDELPETQLGFAEALAEAGQPPDANASTRLDQFQMERMGKKQVLVRRFRPMSTFAFNAMATSVWEFGIFSISQGIVDGGRAGLIWTTVIHAVGFLPIVMSMAEMASMAPTAGSQYHWVSEFAPAPLQKWLSYL